MLKTVGLVARYDNKTALQLTAELAGYLNEKGLKVYIEDTLADVVSACGEFIPLSAMKTDFILT
ncbi:MAG: hypothetical protein ACM3UL_03025, partial [Ignavibacteria bacterium]